MNKTAEINNISHNHLSTKHLSPKKRAWIRFKNNKRGYYSLWIFCVLFGLSLFAELISNDRPMMVSYDSQFYFPIVKDYPETVFGGDFVTNTDYNDPFIQQQFLKKGNWALYPINRYSFDTINYYADLPNPAMPTAQNVLGTDDRGRDVLARLIYGFRISIVFSLILTVIAVVLGIVIGSIQGYLGGKTDLILQRLIELWGSMPQLYLLIIFTSMFQPGILLLIILLSLFVWIGLSDYVRAEFLRSRNLDYVHAAKALGVSNIQIMFKHILPNSLVPVVTFIPFTASSAILALTSLDYLGLGVPPGSPSLGELLAQGKENIEAWWLSLSTFLVLVGSLILLIFIGEGFRESMDTRKNG